MSWLQALGCGFLCSILAAALSGYIAEQCVTWYRISGREGGSGYFVVFIGLAGLLLGGIIGVVAARFAAGGFAQQLGAGVGVVVALSATAWVIARAGGNVPPTIGGDSLDLLVEIRCPAGWTPNNRVRAGKNEMAIASISDANVQTSQGYGTLNWRAARVESGHTIIPGDVFLYSSSSKRALTFKLGEEEQTGFLLPLPGNPDATHKQWSQWFPRIADSDPVAKGFRYRYRVRETSGRYSERDARFQAEVDAFEAIPSGAPLSAYFVFYDADRPSHLTSEALKGRVGQVIRDHAGELGPLLASPDQATSRSAVHAIIALNSVPESYEEPLRKAAAVLLQRIQKFRVGYNAEDPDTVETGQIFSHYTDWEAAWKRLCESRPCPVPSELRSILREAESLRTIDEFRTIAESSLVK